MATDPAASPRGPAEARETTTGPRTPPPDRPDRRAPTTRRRIEAKLSSRTQLRDAFLLHEVLGPPAALREPGPRAPGG